MREFFLIAQARAGLCHEKSRKQPSRAQAGTGDGQLVAWWQRHTSGVGPGHRYAQGIMAPPQAGIFRSRFLCEAGPWEIITSPIWVCKWPELYWMSSYPHYWPTRQPPETTQLLPPAMSVQHPLLRKLCILHSRKERCLKEFCSISQNTYSCKVNVGLKGNKVITGTLELINLERAWVPEWPHGLPTAHHCLKPNMREE